MTWSSRGTFGLMGRLIRKELSTILRDRRTIITLVLMPLLLYPLLTIAFTQFYQAAARDRPSGTEYRLAFKSRDEARVFFAQLRRGQELLEKMAPLEAPETETRLVPVVDSKPGDLLGDFHLGIEIREVGVSGQEEAEVRVFVCELFYPKDSPLSRTAKEYVERRLAIANHPWLFDPLLAANPHARHLRYNNAIAAAAGMPLAVKGVDRARVVEPLAVPKAPPTREDFIPAKALIPLILILMTMTGAVYPAIDLTAGERERGTLEVLVAAPIPRLRLLFSKYVAVVTVAVLTAVINLVTMTVTVQVSGLGEFAFNKGLTLEVIVRVLLLMLLFAAFFSAVLLSVTSFARSFKEGQAYLIPLMLVSMTPGMASLIPEVRLDGVLSIVPLLNIVLLTRDTLGGQAALGSALVVIFSTVVYAMAAIALAARIFGAEAVLYSEQATWGDLFRRPKEPQPALTFTSALFCVAFLFPVSFIVLRLFIRMSGGDFTLDLVFSALGNLLVFGSLPLLFAYMGRVHFREGFRLERASVWAWFGALLLGLSLWAVADLFHQFFREIGVFPPESPLVLAHARGVIRTWREYSPVPLVAIRAVMPAVFEELFFRGLLLGALLRVMKPGKAILVSSILFGAFHLSEGLLLEKVLTTTLLGLFLGSLAWWSGSVIPGIITHALHNSFLILLAYYRRELLGAGWIVRHPTEKDAIIVPDLWFLTAFAMIILALLSLWWFGRNRLDARKASG